MHGRSPFLWDAISVASTIYAMRPSKRALRYSQAAEHQNQILFQMALPNTTNQWAEKDRMDQDIAKYRASFRIKKCGGHHYPTSLRWHPHTMHPIGYLDFPRQIAMTSSNTGISLTSNTVLAEPKEHWQKLFEKTEACIFWSSCQLREDAECGKGNTKKATANVHPVRPPERCCIALLCQHLSSFRILTVNVFIE